MQERLKSIVSNKKILLLLFVLAGVVASVQSLIGTKTYHEDGLVYNRYNNYTIFEKSFEHLKNNTDLYILYPDEHWDLFKYTPSFSVFFGFFSILPDWLGLTLWNLLNVLVLAYSIYYLPKLGNYQKGIILLIMLIELVTSIQSEQSNALIAGLIIFAFGFLERDKAVWAVLMIVFSMFIKLFGIVAFAIFLFYPKKLKSIVYAILWIAILFFIPLFFVDWEQFIELYASYFNLLLNDHDASYGFSVMGWIHSWFSIDVNKNMVVATGVILFLIPLFRIKMYKEFMFKYLLVCSVLLWIVIFNHKAESPTFIIAMSGVALWFVKSEKNAFNSVLFISAFILTSLSPTDIFPRYLREEFVNPYNLKAFPCILIWFKIIYDMISLKKDERAIQQIT